VAAQCRFLRGSAERLEGIADESVDVVATRAVLAYVADKGAALREFHRVLKPGGRISLAEPIFRDEAFAASALRKAVDAQPLQSQDRFLRLLHRWKSAQFPDTDTLIAASPLVNFSERDLASLAHECRFTAIHLELHIDLQPSLVNGWDAFLRSSPHPWAPPLGHILAERFTPEERSFFEQVLRPTVESPDAVTIDRIAYVTAVKPPR
jgi:SAM-dependent methyltransferase